MWQLHLLAVVLHNEESSLLRPSQHVHLLSRMENGRWAFPGGLGVHDLHDAPLGEANLVVAHDSVVPHRVGRLPVVEVGVAST